MYKTNNNYFLFTKYDCITLKAGKQAVKYNKSHSLLNMITLYTNLINLIL